MNCGPPDQLAPCFLNLNWDSALGSMAASPAPSSPPPPAESLALHNLVGQMSSQTPYVVNALNSPQKLGLSMLGHLHHHHQAQGGLPFAENPMPDPYLDQFSNDPGFRERAARFSCFTGRHCPVLPGHFGLPEIGNLTDFSSNPCLKGNKSLIGMRSAANDTELANGQEESSVSGPALAGKDAGFQGRSDNNARKRKAGSNGKGKESSLTNSAKDSIKAEEEKDLDAKRCKMAVGEENSAKLKLEQHGSDSANGDASQKQGKEKNSTPPEPPKDYIHVRARRGQATDSHSLAERVRREKISQRMKLLQDLVPGCSKLTGKAVMLDEIINYVQSLQRQVEFLSMKLATVNPQLDFTNLPNLLTKEMHQACGSLLGSGFPLQALGAAFPYTDQAHQGNPLHSFVPNPLDLTHNQAPTTLQPFLNGIGDAPLQLGNFWEDLQTVVQMDIGQNLGPHMKNEP